MITKVMSQYFLKTSLGNQGQASKILFSLMMCLVLIITWAYREPVFFRDYAIIWEGVGRMLSGHSPLSDIGMPVGPVVLFLPYIFCKFFGFTWLTLQLAQLFQSLLLIIIGSAILDQLVVSRKVYFWAVALFSLFFVSFLMHPWYNTTALLLLLVSIYLSLLKNIGWLVIAGVFTGLCIFCKQDYGFMAVITCFTAIVGRDLIGISDYRDSFQSKILLAALKKLLLYFLGIILVSALFLFLYEDNYIAYWFGSSIGSEAAANKLSNLFFAKSNGLMFLAILGLMLALKFRSFTLLICASMLLVSAVTRYSSGMYFTSFFFWLFLPPFLYELRYSVLENSKLALKILLVPIITISVILAVKTPLVTAYNFWTSTLTNKAEHYYLDASKVVLPVIDLGACIPILKNIYAPKEACNSIMEIQGLLSTIPNPSVLNITEFTPLTELVSGIYPSDHPLWYHLGITLHEREIKRILFEVNKGLYDLVAVQHYLTEPTEFDNNLIKILRNSSQYKELTPMKSPMQATDCLKSDVCVGEIFLFVKDYLIIKD